jgi:CDP-glucose 4,6-dehydratase
LTTCTIDDAARVKAVLERYRPGVVFHLAGVSQVGAAHASPLDAMRINAGGTAALLEGVRLTVPAARVVFASTTAVYGASSAANWDEDSPLAPVSAYGGSKAAAELIGRTYAAAYGLSIVALRCTNVYGPGDPNPARLVPSLVADLLGGRRPRMRSTGTAALDYLFVHDAVRAFIRAAARLEDRTIASGAFNLSAGGRASALEITQMLARFAGRPALAPETGEERESAPGAVSAERARNQLGWAPQWTLEDGLRQTVQWYIDAPCAIGRGAAEEI